MANYSSRLPAVNVGAPPQIASMDDLLAQYQGEPMSPPAAMNPAPLAAAPLSMAKPDSTSALIQTLVGQDNMQPDQAEALSRLQEAMAPKEVARKQPSKEDRQRFLFELGLGMMAHGGQPGATFFGATGQSGMDANKNLQQKMKEDMEYQRDLEEKRVRGIKDVTGLGLDIGDRSYRRKMDAEKLGLDKAQLEISRMNAGRANRDRYDVQQMGDGTLARINIDTGQVEPLMMDGQPAQGKTSDMTTEDIIRMANDQVAQDVTGKRTLSQATQDLLAVSGSLKKQASGKPQISRQQFIDRMVEQGYDNPTITKYLKQHYGE